MDAINPLDCIISGFSKQTLASVMDSVSLRYVWMFVCEARVRVRWRPAELLIPLTLEPWNDIHPLNNRWCSSLQGELSVNVHVGWGGSFTIWDPCAKTTLNCSTLVLFCRTEWVKGGHNIKGCWGVGSYVSEGEVEKWSQATNLWFLNKITNLIRHLRKQNLLFFPFFFLHLTQMF